MDLKKLKVGGSLVDLTDEDVEAVRQLRAKFEKVVK